jgi:hypothetical protein
MSSEGAREGALGPCAALAEVIADELTEVDSVAFTETGEDGGRAAVWVETMSGQRFRIVVEAEVCCAACGLWHAERECDMAPRCEP